MIIKRWIGACWVIGLAAARLAGCAADDEVEEVHIAPIEHACSLLEQLDTARLVGFETERFMPREEHNELQNVRITQCDHYAEDMSRHFSVVVRQDFSQRKWILVGNSWRSCIRASGSLPVMAWSGGGSMVWERLQPGTVRPIS